MELISKTNSSPKATGNSSGGPYRRKYWAARYSDRTADTNRSIVTTALMAMPRRTAAAKTTRRGRSSSPRTSAQRWTVPRFRCKRCSGAKTKITLAMQPPRSRSTDASRLPRATAKPSSTSKALGCKRLQAAATSCRLWQGTLQNSSGKLLAPSKVVKSCKHVKSKDHLRPTSQGKNCDHPDMMHSY